jgi:hypothetical protein
MTWAALALYQPAGNKTQKRPKKLIKAAIFGLLL